MKSPWWESRTFRAYVVWLHGIVVVTLVACALRVTFWPFPSEFQDDSTPFWMILASLVSLAAIGALYGWKHYQRWRVMPVKE